MIIKSCVGSVILNTRPNPPPLQFIILSEERSLDYFVRPYVHPSDMQFSSLSAYRSLEHLFYSENHFGDYNDRLGFTLRFHGLL